MAELPEHLCDSRSFTWGPHRGLAGRHYWVAMVRYAGPTLILDENKLLTGLGLFSAKRPFSSSPLSSAGLSSQRIRVTLPPLRGKADLLASISWAHSSSERVYLPS